MVDTTGLVTDIQDLLKEVEKAGALRPDEIGDAREWSAGFAKAVVANDKRMADNFRGALNGLIGAVEFREAEVGRKALLRGIGIGIDWMLKTAIAALI